MQNDWKEVAAFLAVLLLWLAWFAIGAEVTANHPGRATSSQPWYDR